jgi:hypothetical protein
MCSEHGIYMNWDKTGMLVENLAFKHQIDAAVETVYTDGAIIRNCCFSQCEETGVKIGYASANVVVVSNRFEDMLNFAVAKYLSSTNGPGTTIIQSNLIFRTALVAGYGQNGSMQSEGIRCIGGGTIIRRNIIEDVGYVGIGLDTGGNTCEENIIRRAQLLLDDGGTIDINSHSNIVRRNLIFDTYGNRDVSNGQLESGWVHGQMGFCIFTQPNDNGNIIEHNTLANNTGGILLDTTCDSLVRSNVVYNTSGDTTGVYTPYHISLLASYSPMGMGDQLVDNIFYSLSSSQRFIKVMTCYDSGSIDRNYYCNPYGDVLMNEIYPDYTQYANYTLAEWRTRYPERDQNSITSLVAFPADAITGIPSEDSKLFVNTNTVTTYFSFGGNEYQDLNGNRITGGVTLDPFRSVVLVLRVLAPPVTNYCQPIAADFDGDQLADLVRERTRTGMSGSPVPNTRCAADRIPSILPECRLPAMWMATGWLMLSASREQAGMSGFPVPSTKCAAGPIPSIFTVRPFSAMWMVTGWLTLSASPARAGMSGSPAPNTRYAADRICSMSPERPLRAI